jgi:hypothetical protein
MIFFFLTSRVSNILILLSQVFMTATVEEVFSQRAVLDVASTKKYVIRFNLRPC